MTRDEQAIRDLLVTWQRASATGDLPRLLDLMAADVVFLVVGRPPIRGRDEFAALFTTGASAFDLQLQSEIGELMVHGDWAHCWTRLSVTMTPKRGGAPIRRSGHTLTILRKEPNGSWVLARDANMLTVES